MIRVTYLVDAPYVGGAELYVARLAGGLDRARFSPSVIMSANETDNSLSGWARALETRAIPVVRVPMRLPFHPADAARIHRALVRLSPDVAHVNMPGPYSGQTGLLAPIARLAGARVVVTEHLPMVARLWKRALVKRAAVRFVDAAVTMTRANADLLVSRQGYPRGRVRVVANGVPRGYGSTSDARAAWGLEPAVLGFVFVGTLLPHKGLQDALSALSSLMGHPWRLLVVGTGPEEGACRHLAARTGVADRVTFLGHRAPDEVERIVGACDALVLPSSVEGLPYVILEAMACAKPVVSTTAYGIPEAVVEGETGFLVAPGDVDALGRALQVLLRDSELRSRMGRAARTRFEERFTLERQLATMEDLYRELATGRPGQPR